MASGEEATRRPSVSSSSVGLESLFPAGSEEQACGDENPELTRLRERLQGWLSPYEPLLLWAQRLLVWERPLYSVSVALTLNTLFWLLSSTSLRPLFLLSVSLLGLVLLERWKPKIPVITVQPAETEPAQSDAVMSVEHHHLLSVAELSHHLAESYLTCCLYLQETLQYKRQHHAKFCVMMSSSCLVLAVLGHYVPGIMISYIIVLSVLLWPLVVYHELIQRMYTGLEPILMKLDYSMKGDTEHRKHDKRKVKKELEDGDEPRAETESESEEELSCFAPTVDVKTTALAMAITDSELSDEEASILESGGFSVSRATTPQLTDLSEDLDQQSFHSDPEESYLRDLPEFPSVEEFPSIDHNLLLFPLRGPAHPDGGAQAEAEPLSPATLLIQHLASPLHFVNTHFNGHGQPPGGAAGSPGTEAGRPGGAEKESSAVAQGAQRSLEALSEEIVSTAISTVVHNTLSALLSSGEAAEESALAELLPSLESHAHAAADATDTSTETTTSPLPPSPAAAAAEEEEPDEAETASAEELPDDTLVPVEDEDFELLDQSELEQVDDEELEEVGSDRQVHTPPPPPQQQQQQQPPPRS